MKAAIKAALMWCVGFLNDKTGPSSTRLVMLAGTLVPLTVWTFLSFYHLRMEAMPESLLFFVGLCLGLKGVDRAIVSRSEVAEIEKHKPPAPQPIPPPAQQVGVQVTQEAG